MNKKYLKGLKPQITKQLALLMAICYLLHPLHQQFKTVFHELAHALEAPTGMLDHREAGKHKSIHEEHQSQLGEANHEHQIIKIWESLFEKSSNEIPFESVVTNLKIDKHLTNDPYWVESFVDTPTKPSYWIALAKLREGHSKKLPNPPKFFVNRGVGNYTPIPCSA